MKLAIFSLYLVVCFSVFSCSHNPYENFQDIQVGSDKEEVFDKIGSPLRSKFQNGKNYWTYRFYDKSTKSLVYKDIILDAEKVLEIRDAKEVDIKEIERKEKLVEQSIKDQKTAPSKAPEKTKAPVDSSILEETSKKNTVPEAKNLLASAAIGFLRMIVLAGI